MPLLQCRCYRCRSCDPVLLIVFVVSFLAGNAALGVMLAKFLSDM